MAELESPVLSLQLFLFEQYWALCLSCWPRDSPGFREAGGSTPHEDKHKAPSSTPPHPLSLQDVGPLAAPFLLHSVGKNHQDGWDTIYLIPNNIF